MHCCWFKQFLLISIGCVSDRQLIWDQIRPRLCIKKGGLTQNESLLIYSAHVLFVSTSHCQSPTNDQKVWSLADPENTWRRVNLSVWCDCASGSRQTGEGWRWGEQKAGHWVHTDDLHSSISDEDAERRKLNWMFSGWTETEGIKPSLSSGKETFFLLNQRVWSFY